MQIKILIFYTACLLIAVNLHGQERDWQNLDPEADGVMGSSITKAYNEILKNRNPQPIIVAVVDSGVDTSHEDLKGILWTDPIDGSHGKSYLTAECGREDITHLASGKKAFYDSLSYTIVPEIYRAGYQAHRKLEEELHAHVAGMRMFASELEASNQLLSVILTKMGTQRPVLSDFERYRPAGPEEEQLIRQLVKTLPGYPDFKTFRSREIDSLLLQAERHISGGLNIKNVLNKEYAAVQSDANVQYDPLGLIEHQNLTPYHGSHVAGIIGAKRNNGVGMDGVADNVQLMIFKVTSNIKELRDAYLADAIRIAADKGAKIINLSFGKPYSWDKELVDEAVKYAMNKDVLIVHAAGNTGQDLDKAPHFPNPVYADSSGSAKAWIEVGATGPTDDSLLVATFSNYGRYSVDVFAPGVQIYSTIPANGYERFDGTSMAAPIVTGIASLVRAYYPWLTAEETKEIVLKSSVKINHDVIVHSNKQPIAIPFAMLCKTGGIVNAYNALKLADEYKQAKVKK